MALTPSTMLTLGTTAPDFSLPDTEGHAVARGDFSGGVLLVMFICNHCPYVKHIAAELKRLGDDYAGRISMLAIQSNDVKSYPDDSMEKMKEEKAQRGYGFPYLLDEDQSVAKAYTAACTPDFFLFDDQHKLAYRGQLDKTRPFRVASGQYDDRNGSANGQDLRTAMDAVLGGRPVSEKQWPSIGCNIKWTPGNEPGYFG